MGGQPRTPREEWLFKLSVLGEVALVISHHLQPGSQLVHRHSKRMIAVILDVVP